MEPRDVTTLAPRAATIRRVAESLGFALVGIAPAEATEHEAELRAWLAAGKHGSMEYLARQADTMIDPRKLVPGAKSVICLADRYEGGRHAGTEPPRHGGTDSSSNLNPVPPTRKPHIRTPHTEPTTQNSEPAAFGRIASYAHGDDYHWVMKRRMHAMADELRVLWPEHEFRSCVDTAPLMERDHAARAGLGWIGKHTLLIHPQLGSWLYLGEIVTTLLIATSGESAFPAPLISPNAADPAGGHCGNCTRCIDACPAQCITPYSVDASRCVSYLTIEHRGAIDPSLHPTMGHWLAGCDVCQQVCPFNEGVSRQESGAKARETGVPSFSGWAEGPHADNPAPPPSQSPLPAERLMHPEYQPRVCAPGSVHPEYTVRPPSPALPLLTVLNWTEAARQASLVKSALKRIKQDMWKRNALIAAGNWLTNHSDDALRMRVEMLSRDETESELVRTTARQVMDRLYEKGGTQPPGGARG